MATRPLPSETSRTTTNADRRRFDARRVRCTRVAGTGSYAPHAVLTNAGLTELVDTDEQWIESRTGIRQRHIAARGERTADLAIRAAERAMESARCTAADLDLILVATITPDEACTPVAAAVQAGLGAPSGCAGFDVHAACSGFVAALSTADRLVRSGAYGRALVIAAERMSSVTDYTDRESCILFGDGAGAFVLEATYRGPGGAVDGQSTGAESEARSDTRSGELIDHVLGMDGASGDAIRMRHGHASGEGDQTAGPFLSMRGREVFRFAVDTLCEQVEQLAVRSGLSSASDIDWVVPHQANQRILDAAAKKLGVEASRVVSNVAGYGNTSSASIPIAIDEAVRDGRIQRGDIVALVGFGGGLTWAASLLRW